MYIYICICLYKYMCVYVCGSIYNILYYIYVCVYDSLSQKWTQCIGVFLLQNAAIWKPIFMYQDWGDRM